MAQMSFGREKGGNRGKIVGIGVLVPHFFGHIIGCDILGPPVEVEDITAVAMAVSCDPPAVSYILTFRIRQMVSVEDIAARQIRIVFVSMIVRQ